MLSHWRNGLSSYELETDTLQSVMPSSVSLIKKHHIEGVKEGIAEKKKSKMREELRAFVGRDTRMAGVEDKRVGNKCFCKLCLHPSGYYRKNMSEESYF